MTVIATEFLKLKRSLGWAVVVVLPVVMVLAGSVGTALGDGFTDGWHTLWIRSIGFYGMAVVGIGIAILASLVWRVEHRGGNWNTLMSGTTPTWRLVAAKTAAVSVLAGAMQLVLLVSAVVVGTVVGLDGSLPPEYWAASLLVVVAQVPVAAVQSSLSLFIRSFAAPVAVALLLTGAGTMALLMRIGPAALVLPHALLTRTTQIGSRMEMTNFATNALTPASASLTVGLSVTLTALIVAATAAVLDRIDART